MKLRTIAVALAVLALSIPAALWAADLSLPHVFTKGTIIHADEVNSNFEVLRHDLAQSDRFVVIGQTLTKAAGSSTFYVTLLDHPLLNGNPNALAFVQARDMRTLGACIADNHDGTGKPWADLSYPVGYEDGRWWIWMTCPGVTYNVLVFQGIR